MSLVFENKKTALVFTNAVFLLKDCSFKKATLNKENWLKMVCHFHLHHHE